MLLLRRLSLCLYRFPVPLRSLDCLPLFLTHFCICIVYDALYRLPVGLRLQPCSFEGARSCIRETLKVPVFEILSLEGRHRIHYLFDQRCTLFLFCCVYCCLLYTSPSP